MVLVSKPVPREGSEKPGKFLEQIRDSYISGETRRKIAEYEKAKAEEEARKRAEAEQKKFSTKTKNALKAIFNRDVAKQVVLPSLRRVGGLANLKEYGATTPITPEQMFKLPNDKGKQQSLESTYLNPSYFIPRQPTKPRALPEVPTPTTIPQKIARFGGEMLASSPEIAASAALETATFGASTPLLISRLSKLKTALNAAKEATVKTALKKEIAKVAGQIIARQSAAGGVGNVAFDAMKGSIKSAKDVGTSAAIGAAGGAVFGGVPSTARGLRSAIKATTVAGEVGEKAVKTKPVFNTVREALESNKDITIKQVNKLGKTTLGKPASARIEYDVNTGKATIYTTNKTTDANLAEEFGHYIDKKIDTDTRKTILSEANTIVENASDYPPNEVIARGIREVITNPNSAAKAPNITNVIEQFGVKITKEVMDTKIPKLESAPKPTLQTAPHKSTQVDKFADMTPEQAKANFEKTWQETYGNFGESKKTTYETALDKLKAQKAIQDQIRNERQRLIAKKGLKDPTDGKSSQKDIDTWNTEVAKINKQLERKYAKPQSTPVQSSPLESLKQEAPKLDGQATKGGEIPVPFIKQKTPSVRLDKLNTSDDVKKLVADVTAATEAKIARQRRGVISEEKMKEMSLGVSLDEAQMRGLKPGAITNPETTVALRQLVADKASELNSFIQTIDINKMTREEAEKFNQMYQAFVDLNKAVAGVRTEYGRGLQTFKRKLTPGEYSDVISIAKVAKELGAENPDEFAKFMVDMATPSVMNNLVALHKAGLLSSGMAAMRQFIQNPAMLISELTTGKIAAALDFLRSKTTGKPREIFAPSYKTAAASVLDTIKSTIDDLTKSKGKSILNIFGGEGTYKVENQYRPVSWRMDESDNEMVRKIGAGLDSTLGNFTRLVLNSMESGDRIFYKARFNSSLEASAKVVASNDGLTGDAFEKAVKELIDNPTNEMVSVATKDAEYALLKQENFFRSMANLAKRTARKAGIIPEAATEIMFPFTGTPSGAISATVDYSPLGLVTSGKEISSKNMEIALSRALLGTAGFMALGAYLYKKGVVTGNAPKDEAGRKIWEAQGKTPRSVLIDGNYHRLDTLSLPGMMMAIGAEVARKSKGEDATKIMDFIEPLLSVWLEQPMLTGAMDIIDLIKGQKNMTEFIASKVQSVFPASGLLKAAKRVRSPYSEPRAKTYKEAISQLFTTPTKETARRDVFGKPIEKTSKGLMSLLDISGVSKKKVSPLLTELDRLTTEGKAPSLTDVEKRSSQAKWIKENKSQEQYTKFLEKLGLTLEKRMSQEINKSTYKKLNDGEKKDALDKIKTETLSEVSKQFGYKRQSK